MCRLEMLMKKRVMKKYIPKNTVYCGNCKWRHFIKSVRYHRSPPDENGWEQCEHAQSCKNDCWTDSYSSCYGEIWRCDYLKFTDTQQDSLLWDGCKECGVHYPKEYRQNFAFKGDMYEENK